MDEISSVKITFTMHPLLFFCPGDQCPTVVKGRIAIFLALFTARAILF
jgi:hypothetical protein